MFGEESPEKEKSTVEDILEYDDDDEEGEEQEEEAPPPPPPKAKPPAKPKTPSARAPKRATIAAEAAQPGRQRRKQ